MGIGDCDVAVVQQQPLEKDAGAVSSQACVTLVGKSTEAGIHDDSGHDSNLSNLSTPVAEGSRTPGDKNDEDNVDTVYQIRIVIPYTEAMEVQIGGADMVQELYHVLLERDQTCHRTCFKIYYETKPLDHFVEIRNISNIKTRAVFYVVEEPYNVREARIHVRHLRDILRSLDISDATNGVEFSSFSCLTAVTHTEEVKSVRSAKLKPDGDCLPPDYVLPSVKEARLKHFLAMLPEQKISALKNIAISSFNPPPGPRKMKGDVLYLVVDTYEGRRFHITCCTRGFFVNATTSDRFDAEPSSTYCRNAVHHSLFDLLSELSLHFRKTLAQLLKARAERHVYERLPTPFQTYSWMVPQASDLLQPDQIRADDFTQPHRVGLEDHVPGQIRDWNEELQTTHDMARGTFAERLCRDRAKFKVYADFLATSVRGAANIVEGSVLAINAMDDPKTHMFIWNNIFFSLGFDVKDHYKTMGGDAAAFAAATADLNAVRSYVAIDHPKLHTLGMAIVDYRGLRLTAQSIIPGILERDQEESVVYGSYDSGKTVSGSAIYEECLNRPAKLLRIAPHKVWNGKTEGEYVTLYTSYESKGIIGNDSRYYLLDLLRTFPPDVNFLKKDDDPTNTNDEEADLARFPRRFKHKLVTLRQELIDSFVEHRYASIMQTTSSLVRQYCRNTEQNADSKEQKQENVEGSSFRQKIEDAFKEKGSEKIWNHLKRLEDEYKSFSSFPSLANIKWSTDYRALDNNSESTKKEEIVETDNSLAAIVLDQLSSSKEFATSENEKSGKVLSEVTKVLNSLSSCELDIRFNPDCFCELIKHAPDEDVAGQRKLVEAASSYLLDEQIPAFVRACSAQSIVPIDGCALVESLHSRGINLRYLGVLAVATEKIPRLDYLSTITKVELLIRCARHIFQNYIRKTDALFTGAATAHFLNCFVGMGTASSGPASYTPSVLSHFDSLTVDASTKKNNKKKRKPLSNTTSNNNFEQESSSGGKTSPVEDKDAKTKETRFSSNINNSTGTRFGASNWLEWRTLSQRSLWTFLAVDAWENYGVRLGATRGCESCDQFVEWSGAQRVAIVRRFCQLAGVQLISKNYSLDSAKKSASISITTPFTESDIYNLVPVVKHMNSRSQDAHNMYLSALARMQQGFPRIGYELMFQAHNMMNNIYGPLHPDLALCLRFLARMAFALGDASDALAQQHKAVLISERCNGIDNYETVFDYINAAHYSFANLQIASSLKLIYRARYLLLVLHGENHLVMGQIDANIGIILYAIQEYELASKFLQNALRLYLKYDTTFCLKTALLYHVIARIHSSRGDFRTALQMEKETFNIYMKLFGEEHEKTKISSECLRQLTKQAVNFQKKMNDVRGNSQALVHFIPMNVQPSTLQNIIEMLNLFNNFIFLKLETTTAGTASSDSAAKLVTTDSETQESDCVETEKKTENNHEDVVTPSHFNEEALD